jgi:SpoVK/Ycf46/Vps4 family AAA+-type ATPase
MLIGHALITGDRSFQHAARILAETGYTPTASRLRAVLLDCLAAYEQLMTIRQTYLTVNHPQAEKRKRLTKHMRRKMPDMPDSVFDPFSACIGALLGVIPPDDSHAPDSVKQLQLFFSLPALRQRLETIDAAVLLEKYEEAGRMIPTFVPVLVGGFNWFLLPLLKQQLRKEGRETSALPTSINLEAVRETIQQEGERTLTSNPALGKLRLYFAIALTVIPAENTTLLTQWYLMFRDILSQLLDYMGISPGLFTNLYWA